MSPELAIKLIRTHDPDFAAKVLMPPEVVWENCQGEEVFEWNGYFLYAHNEGDWLVRHKDQEIASGREQHYRSEAKLEAEIAFLRHYMKSLI